MTYSRLIATAALGAALGVPLVAQDLFDHDAARIELLKGAAGDRTSLDRLVARADAFLARDPGHAQALAWRGSAHFAAAGVELQRGNAATGGELAERGAAEMNRAVALSPDDLAVRILRGTSYLSAVRAMPDVPIRATYLEDARSDFQRAFDSQQSRLESLGTHPAGELLQALGDAYSRQGRPADARRYYQLIASKLAGTVYAARAEAWLRSERTLPPEQTSCVGCHIRSR